jgi:hypothetical protein
MPRPLEKAVNAVLDAKMCEDDDESESGSCILH